MKAVHRNRHLGCPHAFLNGQPIGEFRKSWKTACIGAGLSEVLKNDEGKPVIVTNKRGNEKVIKKPTKIFHDFP